MSKSWWKAIAALLLVLLVVREVPRWWASAPEVTVENSLQAGAGALEALSTRLLTASRWLRNVGTESDLGQTAPRIPGTKRVDAITRRLGISDPQAAVKSHSLGKARSEACDIELQVKVGDAFKLPPLVSEDQATILGLHGPPDAFTFLVEAADSSIFEAWFYRDLGRQIHFLDGVYTGGMETELQKTKRSEPLPFTPWQLRNQPTSACVVHLAGPAVFLTSALVLPGWNDDRQVARRWRLAGGGTMITVDGQLAVVQIDPQVSFDEGQLVVPDLFVGTMEGSERLGAILSARQDGGTYRLSLSPRGQGTTEDGTEIVLDYPSDDVAGIFDLNGVVQASQVTRDGEEWSVTSAGQLSVIRQGNAVMLEIDGRVDGEPLTVSGWLQNGVWQ